MNFNVSFGLSQPEFEVKMEDDNTFETGYDEKITISQDYDDLKNKPTLDGKTIQGDMHEQDPTVPDWAKAPEKPQYSAADVGALPADAIDVLGAGDFAEMWEIN